MVRSLFVELSNLYIMGRDTEASKPYSGTFGMYLDSLRDDHISDDGMRIDASIANVVLR